ncbi:MAG: MAE_28990/MAE_18760 family HEPN-like nuclease [Methylococcales bacterium]
MNVSEFRAQLEEELAWRIEEILFFQNRCEMIDQEEQKDKFRRALVLLLYSNFEGFVKFSLNLYVAVINQENIECKQANYSIAAASLSNVFHSLRDGTKKAPEFKHTDPDDPKLHRFAREREFVERATEILGRRVNIPEKMVDTESNLKPVVLRKNLYRLGIAHDLFSTLEPEMNRLLNLRNRIAHGETKEGISKKLYEELKDSVFRIITEINGELTQAVFEKWYLIKNA